jgi:hypothetical protein
MDGREALNLVRDTLFTEGSPECNAVYLSQDVALAFCGLSPDYLGLDLHTDIMKEGVSALATRRLFGCAIEVGDAEDRSTTVKFSKKEA